MALGLEYRHYRVIHADVPWRFESYSEAGEERSAQAHYGCMSLDDIARLPVEAVAAEDCHLFFWDGMGQREPEIRLDSDPETRVKKKWPQ